MYPTLEENLYSSVICLHKYNVFFLIKFLGIVMLQNGVYHTSPISFVRNTYYCFYCTEVVRSQTHKILYMMADGSR